MATIAHGHHEESFLEKYIFSQDHKMIAKQFLFTGIFWSIVGAAMSVYLDYNWVGLMKRSHF
jgi:heme/copper-type cytochrome/quinol oxidase subunit 1